MNPTAAPSRAPGDNRPAVTVLAGFSPATTQAVATVMSVADERLLVVRHDISEIRSGVVRRMVRTARGVVEDVAVKLVHGCVSCTLREDVLPTLARLARQRPTSDIVLVLPPVVEPEAVAGACAHCLVEGAPVTDVVRFDSYVTVVDAGRVLADLSSTDDLSHRGLEAAERDDRSVADVVARQVEHADTVLLWGDPQTDGYDLTRLGVLMHRLAPWAVHLTVDLTPGILDCTRLATRLRRTARHDATVPGILARALHGFPIAVHEPTADCGVISVLFESRRPFHPHRLHHALGQLSGRTVRGRGHLWLASQPDTVIAWQSAGGGVGMGSLGHWLAALPRERWTEVGDYRRMTADLHWDPYYGDRRTALAFVGVDVDPTSVTDLLNACLLTDAELAEGFDAWRHLADPFAGCFPLPDHTTEDRDRAGSAHPGQRPAKRSQERQQ